MFMSVYFLQLFETSSAVTKKEGLYVTNDKLRIFKIEFLCGFYSEGKVEILTSARSGFLARP